jgi:soluble lytic murein transglycosylase-like protein
MVAAMMLCLGPSRCGAMQGDIYHFVDANGTPHFSDQPSDPRFRLLQQAGSAPRATPPDDGPGTAPSDARRQFNGAIAQAARASRLDAALLHAVVQVESGYNPRAVSRKGALGLMQLMPATARRYGVADPMDAAQNLLGGARYLRDLLDQFHGSKELALAAYNAGAGAVLAHGGRIPPFAETTRYVPAVLRSYEQMRSATRSPDPTAQLAPAEKR